MKLQTILISLISGACLIGATTPPQVSSDITEFSVLNLQNGATLGISYTSSGCFHHESGLIEFTPMEMTYKGETKPMSLLQAQQLDNYFRLLSDSQGEPGGCTSSVEMTLTLSRNGEALVQNQMRDDFCFGFREMTEIEADKILSPDHLKYELFEREEAEQQSLIIRD